MSSDSKETTLVPRPAAGQPIASESIRELERVNKELLIKVNELEYERTAVSPDSGMDDYSEAAQESASIINFVKDLESQIDAAHELKEALEQDLRHTQDQLKGEHQAHKELTARMNLLESKAELADQLREDIAFVEDERNETSRRLKEVSEKLDTARAEQEDLLNQKAMAEGHARELQGDNIDLEAQVMSLKDRVAEMDKLKEELSSMTDSHAKQQIQVRDLTSSLDAADTARSALELDLSTTREISRSQEEQIGDMKNQIQRTSREMEELRTILDREEIENRNLLDSNRRFENELRELRAKHEAVGSELESCKRALGDIRTAAVRTTGRVRERYYKPLKE